MSKSFTPWRPEEDAILTELYHKNLTYPQIAEVIGRSADAVDTRRRKIGLKREFVSHKSPPPDDLREMARTMNVTQLVKHYGRIRSVVVRWMDELKLTEVLVSSSGRKKAVPDNFRTMAPTMTCADWLQHRGGMRGTTGWAGCRPMKRRETSTPCAAWWHRPISACTTAATRTSSAAIGRCRTASSASSNSWPTKTSILCKPLRRCSLM